MTSELPVNVLFVHHCNDLYGADFGLLHSIQTLDRTKYRPFVILPSDTPDGPLAAELERLHVEFRFMPLGILRRKYLSPGGVFGMFRDMSLAVIKLALFMRKMSVRIIYVNTAVSVSGAIAGRLAGGKVVWHIREILSLPAPARRGLHFAISRLAHRIVCVSQAVEDSILKDQPSAADKCVLVYNAVDLPINSTTEADAMALRAKLGIPIGAPIVGMIGRVTHWKGQDVLVKAAASILHDFPNTYFLAVGSVFSDERHYLTDLQSEIANLHLEERFFLMDYERNVAAIYTCLDVFVMASKKPEPFGRVTVEAMLCGRPVVGTAHGGTTELVHEGVHGFLVEPDNPAQLASAISLLLADPELRQRMGKAGRERALTQFGLPRYGAQLGSIFDQLTLG